MAEAPHSAEQFVASRDLWWHEDYLDLLARRLRLADCRRVLELGAGVGHWTAHVLARVASDAVYLATDREPDWVAALAKKFADRPGFSATLADAANLAHLGGPFDLVTCQTLMLHLDDPGGVLAACFRLMAPDGLLLLAEPNNFLNRLPVATVAETLTPQEYGRLAALWWAYERGRARLGLGRETIAEHLPRLITAAGFRQLQVFANDRLAPEFAPYDSGDQALLAAAPPGDHTAVEATESEADFTRRLALAGGLSTAEFEAAFALYTDFGQRRAAAVAAGTYAFSGGGYFYVFAARKP